MQANVVVVGGGVGGLVAACLLGRAGVQVTLLEAQAQVGGKMHQVDVAGRAVDMGPSVLTLRHVFDDVFAACGARLDDAVQLTALPQLARHVFGPGSDGAAGAEPVVLDLYADAARTGEAIGDALGARAAREYAAFAAYAARLYAVAGETFMYAPKPTFWRALRQFGPRVLQAAWEMDARRSMWQALQQFFPTTPALAQLYGRYATYCGASPFAAPATLNLVSHVERLGVWGVAGGLSAIARALAALAGRQGVTLRTGAAVAELTWSPDGRVRGVRLTDGECFAADAVVLAGGLPAANGQGPLWRRPEDDDAAGRPLQPGLSADVVGLVATPAPGAVQPATHNVFFTGSARDEFAALFDRGVSPQAPTLYVCAADRARPAAAAAAALAQADERFFCLVNAPPTRRGRSPEELRCWSETTLARLAAAGLPLQLAAAPVAHQASDFARRFPGSDGVLYGRPPHAWNSFFTRQGSRTRWPGCYAAGGTVHPGPGVPMAALSGRLAAEALLTDCPSLARCRPAATPGGTSTPKATTAPTS